MSARKKSTVLRKHVSKVLLSAGAAMNGALLGTGLVAAAIVPTVATAQDYTNVTASGRVQGTDGKAIAGASVEYKSNAQGFTRSTTTDEAGSFRMPQLPAGEYTVTISADGYTVFADSAVNISPDRAANRFTLAAVGAMEEIVVTAGRVEMADFERNTTGAVINISEISAVIPVARDITSVVQLAPATTLGDTAFGNLPNIGGASVAENAYFINGLNITEFREGLGAVSVPFEFYETVEVKSGGFQAEFGRTTGGVVNAVTRSGSNEFKGAVLFNYEPDSWRSDGKDTVFSENSREEYERMNTNFWLSGPIIKDRLFFFALYEQRDIEYTNTVTAYTRIGTSDEFNQIGSQYYKYKTDDPFWAVKIDAIPFDGHRIELTYFDSTGELVQDGYNYNSYSDINNGTAGFEPGPTDYLGTTVEGYGGENYVGRYTGIFTDWMTFSAAYGKNENRNTVAPSRPDYPYIIDNRSGTATIVGNFTQIVDQNFDEREFYRADIDFRFQAFGSHHVRLGYDREDLTTDSTSYYPGPAPGAVLQYYNSGALGDDNVATPDTDYVAARTHINGGVFESQNEAYYIQDSWSLMDDRLTLQFGMRNDIFSNSNADGDVFYDSGDNWAPRIGASFDPFGEGRTKIYGSFAEYMLPVAANTNIRLAGAELDYTRYNLLQGTNADQTPIVGAAVLGVDGAVACQDTGIENCVFTSDGTATPTEATVAKNLAPQSMDEWILGIEHTFETSWGGDWKVGLSYTHRELNRALEDAAIDAAVNQYCVDNGIATYEECSSIYSGFHQYVLINPGSAMEITLSDPLPGETEVRTINFSAEQLGYPKATRKYDAVSLTFERPFDDKWSLQGSYTWSRLKGNYEGAVKSDNGQTDAGLTTDFDQPGFTYGADGYGPNHREHNFKVFGTYQFTDWLMVSANYTVLSPRKFGCIGRIPASVDPFAQFYGAAGWYCNVDANGDIITDERTGVTTNTNGELTPRASQFQSDWRQQLDMSFNFYLPLDMLNAPKNLSSTLRFDVFNVFGNRAALDFEERGTLNNGRPRNTYRQVASYQGERFFRMQLSLNF